MALSCCREKGWLFGETVSRANGLAPLIRPSSASLATPESTLTLSVSAGVVSLVSVRMQHHLPGLFGFDRCLRVIQDHQAQALKQVGGAELAILGTATNVGHGLKVFAQGVASSLESRCVGSLTLQSCLSAGSPLGNRRHATEGQTHITHHTLLKAPGKSTQEGGNIILTPFRQFPHFEVLFRSRAGQENRPDCFAFS